MKKVMLVLFSAALFGVNHAAIVDDFESYPTGIVKDVATPPWESNGTSLAEIRASGNNKFLSFGFSRGYRGAFRAIPPITETDLAALSVQIRVDSGTTARFGLSDVAGYDGGFEIQLGILQDGDYPILTAYNGKTEITGLATLQASQWYTLTIEIDQANDTFNLFLTDDSVEGAQPMGIAGGFSFVNGTTDDIVSFGGLAFASPDFGFSIDNLTGPMDLKKYPYDPSPHSNNFEIDPASAVTLTWQAPEDPNVASIEGYDVYYYGISNESVTAKDPNFVPETLVSAASVQGTSRSYTPVEGLEHDKSYFWRVDTHVVFTDPNGLTDPENLNGVIQGRPWKFETIPAYRPPILNIDNVITSMELLPLHLSAAVTKNSLPIQDLTFTLLTNDWEFPAGATATLVPDNPMDNQNPGAILNTNMTGTYKVKLSVSDGTTAVEDIIEIKVYADACQAKKNSVSGWTKNYYDRDEDCDVDLIDFAKIASEWLDDSSMQAPETTPSDGNILYIPKAAMDKLIEAESVGAEDVSNPPVTDNNGIRVLSSGSRQFLGYSDTGAYADYEIEIPAKGTYSIAITTAANSDGQSLNFGDGTTADLYGSVGPFPNRGWDNFDTTIHHDVLTFTTAGTQTLRITWVGGLNLDWFTIY